MLCCLLNNGLLLLIDEQAIVVAVADAILLDDIGQLLRLERVIHRVGVLDLVADPSAREELAGMI